MISAANIFISYRKKLPFFEQDHPDVQIFSTSVSAEIQSSSSYLCYSVSLYPNHHDAHNQNDNNTCCKAT